MVEAIRTKAQSARVMAVAIVTALGFFMLSGQPLTAAAERRTVSVTINTGESYTIPDVSKDSTPGVKVVENPNALVVHTDAPGKIVLLGAAAGSWDIDVTLDSGEKVTYAVNVKPPVMASAAPASASKAADAGSGPVETAAVPPSAASSTSVTAKSSPPAPAAAAAPAAPAPADASAKDVSAPSPAPATSAAEPVKVASADSPPAPAADPAASAPSASAPAAPAPDASAAAAPAAATAPAAAPNPGDPAGAMAPSQTASAQVQAPVQKFSTDPLATMPSPSAIGEKHFLPGEGVDLMVGTSQVLDFPNRIRRVSIADSKTADIQVINPYEVNLVGHQPGFTTLAVWDTQGRYVERQIRVDASGKQQVLLNVIVAELDRARTETFGINFSAALPRWDVSLVNMVGGVATPYTATTSLTANALVATNPPVVVSNSATGTLPPGGTTIPLLLSQNLTYGLAAGNSNIQTQSFFQFMEAHSLAKILAQPHLLANSGEKAQFLSGGEIPIVIAQALNTSIVFKQFGTSVTFVPTVVGLDDIELQVKPEVSEPDYAHAVQMFGFTIPAFVTRKAETMVRLKNNQTLIVAGLLLNEKHETVNKVPYLGDIPWVRGLFRNTYYTNSNTDLVMTVTPQIVAPLPVAAEATLPTERGPMTSEEIQTRRVYPDDAGRPRF